MCSGKLKLGEIIYQPKLRQYISVQFTSIVVNVLRLIVILKSPNKPATHTMFLSSIMVIVLFKIIFKASALWADAFYKSICPYVCLSVCLSVCLFTFEVPFKRLFAPTSRRRMSKIFRDSESLGKSNGKKWSQI